MERGNTPAKGWLGTVNNVMKLAKSAHGRKAANKSEINGSEILPLAETARCQNERIALFREKQMARWFDSNLKWQASFVRKRPGKPWGPANGIVIFEVNSVGGGHPPVFLCCLRCNLISLEKGLAYPTVMWEIKSCER